MKEFIDSLGALTPIIGILFPVFIVLIVFIYDSRNKKNKYDAIIEVSKNIKDGEEIQELLDTLTEKKSSTDLRRTGLATIFTGIGLSLLGYYGLGIDAVFGAGLLVAFIGIGQMIAGYVYPNQADEINRAVKGYEKK
jgi:hypothetical protein|tara:strand:- start:1719 stop:2129 length:411 start_codon:yes stop_codon:yes gene_type:complete